jgi:hypothetical protein
VNLSMRHYAQRLGPAERSLISQRSGETLREKPPITLPSIAGKTYDFHDGFLRVDGVPQPPLRRL